MWLCGICDTLISSKYAHFQRHVKLHEQHVERYKCDLCPKTFGNPSNLRVHFQKKHPLEEDVKFTPYNKSKTDPIPFVERNELILNYSLRHHMPPFSVSYYIENFENETVKPREKTITKALTSKSTIENSEVAQKIFSSMQDVISQRESERKKPQQPEVQIETVVIEQPIKEIKSQLANATDNITTLDMAPQTKRLMYLKETGGVEQLFALPSRDIRARDLLKNYQRNLKSRSTGVEDFSMLGPPDVLALNQYQEQPLVKSITTSNYTTSFENRSNKFEADSSNVNDGSGNDCSDLAKSRTKETNTKAGNEPSSNSNVFYGEPLHTLTEPAIKNYHHKKFNKFKITNVKDEILNKENRKKSIDSPGCVSKKRSSVNIEDGIRPKTPKTSEALACHNVIEQILEMNIQNCGMKNHPDNYLPNNLPKYPVCQRCLVGGKVMKCNGKCSSYFHKQCLGKKIIVSEYNCILKRKMREDNNDDKTNAQLSSIEENIEQLKCEFCTTSRMISCFVCSKLGDDCIQCCNKNCGKAYHIECLKYWPQHKKTYESNKIKCIDCPRHVCHSCVSPEIQNHNMEFDKKLIKCLLCPGTYHQSFKCIPAGSELLSKTQLICARHQSTKNLKQINIDYCLICSQGGTLICCDGCVYSFHPDCLNVSIGDHFICEKCESGRQPLNREIVWCKYSKSPWWPAIIVPPLYVPGRVLKNKKEPHQICVYFFGTHNYGWVSQTQMYLFINGDSNCLSKNHSELFKNAVAEAEIWMQNINEINAKSTDKNKPPQYRKIKTNKIIAKFKGSKYRRRNYIQLQLG